jgi:2-keto-4-pentenoate hydratase/2-oxohepta-3-ene-1,7-dioic acid hydratase in catechol pathway
MKLVLFGSRRLGALQEDGAIIDLNLAYATLLSKQGEEKPYSDADARVPNDLLAFIEEGDSARKAAEEAVSMVREGVMEDPQGERLAYRCDEVKIHAPLPSLASRIAMAGANFYDHAVGAYTMIRGVEVTREEIEKQVEDGSSLPWGFWKQARNVVGTGEPIVYPARTERLDYEVEVAAIFGKTGKDISEEEALDYIYGYTIVNDMSCRDQQGDRGLFLSKNFDTSAPMGPCIVTADEVGDPHKLGMRLMINGVLKQGGTQEDMIRYYPWWISFLSRDMTFYPGDMICGGTCAGTALDTSPRDEEGRTKPDNFLKPGDLIEAWVERIGTLRNPVVAKG